MSTTPQTPGPSVVREIPKPERPEIPKPIKALPTDRITFSKQLEILRAYVAASNNGTQFASVGVVAEIVKLNPTTIPHVHSFFNSIGLLQKGDGGYVPTAHVLNFVRAYEWNQETASHKLAPVIAETWFAKAVIPRLSFEPLAEEYVLNLLADSAVAGPEYKKELKLVVDYLIASGLIQRDGTMLKLVRGVSQSAEPQSASDARESSSPSESIKPAPRFASGFTQTPEGGVVFNVSFKVDMAEMGGWKPEQIAAFFGGIAQVLSAKAAAEKGCAGNI